MPHTSPSGVPIHEDSWSEPMTGEKKAPEGEKSKPLSAEETAENLKARGVSPVATTASGQAAAAPKGENTAGEGGEGASEIQDTILKPGKNVGAQEEPAQFTVNGSLPHNHIASPSGPQPAGLIADEGMRKAAVDATQAGVREAQRTRRNSRQRLTDEQIDRMSPAELRAVAHDRGYDVGEGGRRAIASAFKTAQKEDESDLWDPKEADQAQAVPLSQVFGGGIAAGGPAPAVGGQTTTPFVSSSTPASPTAQPQSGSTPKADTKK